MTGWLRERGALSSARAKARAVGFFVGLGVLTVLTSLPGRVMPKPDIPFWDKWAHGVAYTVLGVLFWRWASSWERPLRGRAMFWLVAGFCAAWGFVDELHQLFVPRRACDPADMLVDALGGLLAATLCSLPRGPVRAFLNADVEGWLLRLPAAPPNAPAKSGSPEQPAQPR